MPLKQDPSVLIIVIIITIIIILLEWSDMTGTQSAIIHFHMSWDNNSIVSTIQVKETRNVLKFFYFFTKILI